jgi:C-terminal processing protease CtpA/Prc
VKRRALLLPSVALFLLAALPGTAAEEAATGDGAIPTPDPRWERVAGLCQVWTAAELLHPTLFTSDLDWDAAFVEAATATADDPTLSTEGYRAIAAAMLAHLGDPATRLVEPTAEGGQDADAADSGVDPEPPADVPLVRELEAGVLLFDLPAAQRARGNFPIRAELMAALGERMASARAAIVDLRSGDAVWWTGNLIDFAAPQLVPVPVVVPGERTVVHWGYAPEQGGTSGGYRSAMVTTPDREIRPAGEGGAWRLVFLSESPDYLPDVVRALQLAGHAKVVAAVEPSSTGGGRAARVELAEGVRARLLVGQRTVPPGAVLGADVVLAPESAGDRQAAVDAALELLRSEWPVRQPSSTASPIGVRPPRRTYADMTMPSAGYRLLAGCRTWGVIHHFYPYLHLLDDWDGAFRASLPALHAAADEPAYVRAILELTAHIADGHTGVYGHRAIGEVLGSAFPAVELRLVEGEVALTAVHPERAAGLRVGDVVRSVDGEPLPARIDEILPLGAGSTPVTRRRRAAVRALAGAPGSTAVLEVEGADGLRRVEVPRGESYYPEPPGPAWRRVAPRVGYVDLRLLETHEVSPMLEELRDTDALVFDMRGYPNGTAWTLAPRLNRKGATVAAQFRGREVGADSLESPDSGYFFSQSIPPLPDGDWIYPGRTVMLIDERAISQAEHTGLFLEAASDVVFVGEPTAGANGDVTNFSLPGGLRVGFTGHDVRHADGRPLQRVGLQPHVPVAPTLAGLRAGRDEVLERALAWLAEQGIGAAAPAAGGE